MATEMMKRKLIELMDKAEEWATEKCDEMDCDECPADKTICNCMDYLVADFLIANGVTIQKWIPVSERLPEDVYGKDREQIVVLVCTKSGKVSQCSRMADYECIADETLTKVEWTKNGKFYWSKNKAVTHWMPLPEPPKEGDGK